MKQQHILALRTASALCAIPAVLALLWFGGWVLFLGACGFLALAVHEYTHMARCKDVRPLWLAGFLASAALSAAALWPSFRPWVSLGLVGSLAGGFAWRGIRVRRNATADLVATLVFVLYVGGAFACMLSIRGFGAPHVGLHPLQLGLPTGMWWMLVMLCGTWAFDTGAYLVGRKLGRHKMAPVISPKKSWEGVAGGLVAAIPSVILATRPLGMTYGIAAATAVAIAGAAILGDLAESAFKRWAGVKDSGRFLPGHGGLFDRIDSVMLVAFVVFAARLLLAR